VIETEIGKMRETIVQRIPKFFRAKLNEAIRRVKKYAK
jgi:hypothetical protein